MIKQGVDEPAPGALGGVGLLGLGGGGLHFLQSRFAFAAFGGIRIASEEQLEHGPHEIFTLNPVGNIFCHFDGHFAVKKCQGLLRGDAFGAAIALQVVSVVKGFQELVLLVARMLEIEAASPYSVARVQGGAALSEVQGTGKVEQAVAYDLGVHTSDVHAPVESVVGVGGPGFGIRAGTGAAQPVSV